MPKPRALLRPLLLASLALLPAVPAAAAAAPAPPRALLWIPDGAAGAGEIISLLEAGKDLRLTAAFSDLPADLDARVRKLEADGRLETALRAAGDPPLLPLYYPALDIVRWENKPATSTFSGGGQFFLGLRFGLMRDAALKRAKKTPAGIALPPGGLAPDYFALARALGAKWLACGPLASTAAAVLTADGVAAVPFTAVEVSSPPAAALSTQPAAAFLVYDETAAADPAALRAALAAELRRQSNEKLLTVSEALKTAAAAAAAPAEIAALAAPWRPGAWAQDYSRWAAAPLQAGALTALARTRADLMLHLNAGGGDFNAARAPFEAYFSAEEGAKLAALASPDPDTARETEFAVRSALGNAYRLMAKAPPPWIYSSLAEAAAPEENPDEMKVALSTSGFEIRNNQAKPELKAAPPGLPKTADPYRIWKLDRMSVEVQPDAVVFRFYPLETDNAMKYPSGFSHIALDVYIDINRRPRAGKLSPLPGRPLRLFPENAWEYALEIGPAKAALHSSAAGVMNPVYAAKPRLVDGAVTVSVPRTVLKGNPLLWGYAALMLAPGENKDLVITDKIAADIANGYIYAVFPGKK